MAGIRKSVRLATNGFSLSSSHSRNTMQATAQISQTKICVCRHFVAKFINEEREYP